MNLVDKTISYFAPGAALKRIAAREAIAALSKGLSDEAQRAFEVVESARYRDDWTNLTQDADAANVTNLQALRNLVRDLSHRSGMVAGPLKRLTNNVVGHGIRPQSRVRADGEFDGVEGAETITEKRAERFNYQAEKAFRRWQKKSDAYLLQSFYEQQALAFRTMVGDGEVLAVLRSSNRNDRIIPLCIELIEIDRLSTPMEKVNNPKIRNGIEFDDEGVPVRYYVLKRHPGSTGIISTANFSDYETIEAYGSNGLKKVLHLYDILRPNQSRGYTPFAAGLEDMQQLSRYKEAIIVGARIRACLALFIKKPTAYNTWNAKGTNTDGQRISGFEPGMVRYLNAGEEPFAINPSGSIPEAAELTKQFLQWAANAVDIPYEVFANDWKGLNYSNARTVLLQAYLAFRVYQRYMIEHFCEPIWENFISDCVANGIVKANGFGLRKDDYFRSSWITPGWQWVDPEKEANAAGTDLNNLIDNLANILAGKGEDWEEQVEQRARELKKIKDLEKKYGVTMTQQDKAATQQSNQPKKQGDKEDGEE
ncbi:MAG: Phage portal protein, lambda family [Syntrophorhabdus sp. PtaU1.Bin153]|nr:MAG: Phage portal protein, lambda family [Syntrophorhabdus sp. PtaU1.Bin153]